MLLEMPTYQDDNNGCSYLVKPGDIQEFNRRKIPNDQIPYGGFCIADWETCKYPHNPSACRRNQRNDLCDTWLAKETDLDIR